MLVSSKQFELYCKEVYRLIRLFGLTQYEIFFKLCKLKDAHAEVRVQENEKLAVFCLDNTYTKDDPCDPIKSAKHEVLHLLIWRLEWLGMCRYMADGESKSESEAIVRRLEKCEFKNMKFKNMKSL